MARSLTCLGGRGGCYGGIASVSCAQALRKQRARILTVLQQKGVAPSAAAAAPVPLVTKTTPKAVVKKAVPKKTAPKTVAPKKVVAKSKKGA